MSIKDILVALTSYPDPTPISAVEEAIAVAAALEAHITALSCEVHVEVPGHFLSGSVVGLPAVIAGETAKSHKDAQSLIAAFDDAARKNGASCESIIQRCKTTEVPELLCEYARLRDLTIMPESSDRSNAEAVIFGSGRPVLAMPRNPRSRPFKIVTVAVAWDFSRAAARAVSDALPLLEKASKVRVVTVLNEKHLDRKHSAEELSKNLSRHGIDVVLDLVDTRGRSIDAVLNSYVSAHEVDVLVMGAYGHSRLREFVLGGATRSLLSKPPLPILFSH
ncbi:universal stress protein [Bradyrhizobium sp. 2S1]|uniref:universal stress protein n=1 Tax=Bradyrhizobium sp. 2S1 TaxID=1404429 RepID=UPI001408A2CC|nr:universal stress protein [Bradyrhizobium sp. 2S1]MCK7670341.1 universal stress protein [Bradyrhizobium sp. 2S1]